MGEFPSIERYVVEAELGSGGFGAVYRARHVVLDRKVALKVLHPQRAGDTEVLMRFLREARAIAQLGSPHIVQVLDADMTGDGRGFIAMELLEGEDLAHRLLRGRMPTHEVLRVAREVLAALVVAHGRGVIHRDLKPGNVFLAKRPDGDFTAKVLDFGISKVRSESPTDELTRTGTMLGTPQYMAPEQFRSSRDVDGRADLYSLGVLLYEALAGRQPFEGETLQQLIALKLTEVPRPLAQVSPTVPQAVAEVVMRAIAMEPDQRYASAAEMDAALAAVESRVSAPGVSLGRTSGRPAPMSTPPPASVAPPAASSGGSRLVRWVVGIGAVVLIGTFAVLGVTAIGLYLARDALHDALGDSTPAPAPTTAPAAPPIAPRPAPVAPMPAPILPPTFPIPLPQPTSVAPDPRPTVATGEVAGVRVVGTTLGLVDTDAVREVADRARPALAACRSAERFHETLQFVINPGGALASTTHLPGSATHDCAIAALTDAGPVRTLVSGIARFDVTLERR